MSCHVSISHLAHHASSGHTSQATGAQEERSSRLDWRPGRPHTPLERAASHRLPAQVAGIEVKFEIAVVQLSAVTDKQLSRIAVGAKEAL
jgi:hypothetical protein